MLEKFLNVESIKEKAFIITNSQMKKEILKYRKREMIIDSRKVYTESEFIRDFVFVASKSNQLILHNNNPFQKNKLDVATCASLERTLHAIYRSGMKEHKLWKYANDIKSEGYEYYQPTYVEGYQIIVDIPQLNDLLMLYLKEYDDVLYTSQSHKLTKVNVVEYNHVLGEIEETVIKVGSLIAKGVDISKIELIAPSGYESLIKQQCMLSNIPINSKHQMKLIQYYELNTLFDAIIDNDMSSIDNIVKSELINIANEYIGEKYSIEEFRPFIEFDIKNAKVSTNELTGLSVAKRIESGYSDLILKDKYIFLLGNFQDGLITYQKNDDLIEDNLRHEYDLITSNESNAKKDEVLHALIANGSNIYISYSLKTVDKAVELANNLKFANVIHESNINEYFKALDEIRFARANYIYETFKVQTESYNQLSGLYKVEYKDNRFNGTNRRIENLDLSYTSINNFYKCQYKFYMQNILRIRNGKFDDRKMILGSMIHSVLEQMDKFETISLQNIYQMIIQYVIENEIDYTSVDEIYFKKFARFLELVFFYMKQEEQESNYDTIEREASYEWMINSSRNIKLVGKIDKVMSKIEGDNLFLEIYDYKTGMVNFEWNKVKYGLNMQNLIYFLLIKKTYIHEDGDEFLEGTYQHQIKPKLLVDDQTDLENMKIHGYSTSKSEYQFPRKIKPLSNDVVNANLEMVEENTLDAVKKIIDNEFTINPKIIDGKNESCTNCEYLAICKRTFKDMNFLKTKE